MVREDCKHYQPPSGWCDGDCCELRKDFFTPCENCEHYESKNKRTNAMKIRSMTDEELAEWLNHMQADAYNRGMLEDWIVGYPNHYDNWLDWLKEETDHD